MKASTTALHRASALQLLLGLVMIGSLAILAAGGAVYLAVRPSSDFRALQQAVIETLPRDPLTQLNVRAPSLIVSLARTAISHIEEIDEEARLAIDSVHGGEVCIMELRGDVSRADYSAIMQRADEVVLDRDWTRVVGVLDERQMVLVYIPSDMSRPDDVRAMVVVLNDRQLVMAGAAGDLTSLLKLAQPHLREARAEIQAHWH